MAGKATNTSGVLDTSRVSRSMLYLRWQMRVPTYSTDPRTKKRVRGDYDNKTGTSRIWWTEKIFDYFGIPSIDVPIDQSIDADTDFWSQTPAQIAKYFQDLTAQAATTTVQRKQSNKLITEVRGDKRTGLSVQVPLIESKKANGDYRRVNLLFPRFYNLVMVTQALVQIFSSASKVDRRPPFFWTQAGTKYSLPYAQKVISTKGVIAPADCGAWVVTSPGTTNNSSDDNIPNNDDSIGGGGGAGKASDNSQ